jgi:predicted ribosomally synthesized peptide with SipW-like signal peptide
MAKRIRILMTAVATILICVALIAVGSYALFSDTTRVTNHLQAGDLDIKLWRIDLAGKGLDDDGFMTDVKDTLDKDFTSTTTDNIFNLDNTKYVVPTSKYVAEMMISRSASTNVAIGYWLDFVIPNVDTSKPANAALLSQLKITIEIQEIGETGYTKVVDGRKLSELSNVATADGNGTHYAIGSISAPIDVIDTTESLTSNNIETALATGEEAIALFKVTVEFEDNLTADNIIDSDGNLIIDPNVNTNNAAKNGKVSFDIVVNAVQVVSE